MPVPQIEGNRVTLAKLGYNGFVLKKIRLVNFKLHADTRIEASRITVFIGPNNSGKSSIFQALLALRQASARGDASLCKPLARTQTSLDQPYLFPNGELIDPGEFTQILGKVSDQLEVGVWGEYVQELAGGAKTPVGVDFHVVLRENCLVAHSGTLDTGAAPNAVASWDWVKGSTPHSSHVSLPTGAGVLNFLPTEDFKLIHFSGVNAPSSQPRALALANPIAERLVETPARLLETLQPVLPVRGFEEWGYPLPSFRPRTLALISLSDRALALATLLPYNRGLEEELSERLGGLLGIQIRFQLVEPRKVIIWAKARESRGRDTLFANEGSGANQLPFILVPIALAKPGETILLSEPEAHLHPKAQSQLTVMLLEVSRKADLQFFIETHSEHVLHRLLHAVAKGELARDDLTIYYFPEPEDGKANPRKLKIDEQGGVEGGLPGFFDQSLDELTEYIEALKQPKK